MWWLQGDIEDKVAASFHALGMSATGDLTQEEVFMYLLAGYRILFAVDGRDPGDIIELAIATTRSCFEAADTDGDGVISFRQFMHWYTSSDASQSAAAPAPAPKQAARSAGAMPDMRRLTGLSPHSAEDVMEHFAQYVDARGMLTLDNFIEAFSVFQPDLRSERETLAVVALRERLFDLFADAEAEAADFTAVMAGLSLLCGGSKDDKIAAVFNLIRFALYLFFE